MISTQEPLSVFALAAIASSKVISTLSTAVVLAEVNLGAVRSGVEFFNVINWVKVNEKYLATS